MKRAALLLLAACGAADLPDASQRDAGSDAGRDAGEPAIALPEPASLPLGEADVLALGPGLVLDVTSSFGVDADGAISVVFDTFDAAFARGELREARSIDGVSFTAARSITFVDRAYEANPSHVGATLYFSAAGDLSSAPDLFEAGASLPRVPGVASLLSWPRFSRAPAGVLLAFRDGASRPMFASGPDAASLAAPIAIDPGGAAMITVEAFGDGALAYAYQRPEGAEPMVSYLRRSIDGATWTAPARVTDRSSNVHDTTLTLRSDGALDAYYAFPVDGGFELHRRAISADGAMGPEERVTALDGEPTKPAAFLLASGRVLLAFAAITARNPITGEPTRQTVMLASLPGEAAAP